MTIVGLLGAAFGVVFLFLFLTNEQLGLTSQLAYTVVGGVLLFSAAWYLVAKTVRRSQRHQRGLRVQGDPAGVIRAITCDR